MSILCVESSEQWGVRLTYPTWLSQTPEETLQHALTLCYRADAEFTTAAGNKPRAAIWEKNQPLTKMPYSSGGCIPRNTISCNCRLISPEYLSIFEIIKCIWIAIISPTQDCVCQAIMLDETLMISVGKLGCSSSKDLNDTQNTKCRFDKHNMTRKYVTWLQETVMLAANTAGLLSFLLRRVISRQIP